MAVGSSVPVIRFHVAAKEPAFVSMHQEDETLSESSGTVLFAGAQEDYSVLSGHEMEVS